MNSTNGLILAALAAIIPSAVGGSQFAYDTWFNQAGSATQVENVSSHGGGSILSIVTPAVAEAEWIASAPGRVEPKAGEIKIGAALSGRVNKIAVEVNQTVSAGDILIELDDDGAAARFQSAKVEAANRKKERDDNGGGDGEFRVAEDEITIALIAFWTAQDTLDRAVARNRESTAGPTELEDARNGLNDARVALKEKQDKLADLRSKKKPPTPGRSETVLAAARAEMSIASAMLEKTKIRAPADGTVLLVDVNSGEMVSPSPDQVLVIMGDMTGLRVRAELEERDVGKVRLAQTAIIRADAFTGQDFSGTVTKVAPALTAPELGSRGPNKRTDVDVLEILLDLDPNTPLVPGMRVDVFFKDQSPVASQ